MEKPENLDLAAADGTAITDHNHFICDRFVVGQHVVTHKNNLRRGRWILGEYDPNIAPLGVVVDVRAKMLVVNWVAQRHQGANLQVHPDVHLYPDQDPIVVLSVSPILQVIKLVIECDSSTGGSRLVDMEANEWIGEI